MQFATWLEMNYEFSKIKIYLPTFQNHYSIKTGDKVYTTEKLARSLADKILQDQKLPAHVLMTVVKPKELSDTDEDNKKEYCSVESIACNVVYKTD